VEDKGFYAQSCGWFVRGSTTSELSSCSIIGPVWPLLHGTSCSGPIGADDEGRGEPIYGGGYFYYL
jgi:hypothetical protein